MAVSCRGTGTTGNPLQAGIREEVVDQEIALIGTAVVAAKDVDFALVICGRVIFDVRKRTLLVGLENHPLQCLGHIGFIA